MKKVNLEKRPTAEVYLEDLTNENHIGFWLTSGRKGYVSRTPGYTFSALIECSVKMCNDCFTIQGNSIKELIQNINTIQDIYLFDTRKDLYKWLAEYKSDPNPTRLQPISTQLGCFFYAVKYQFKPKTKPNPPNSQPNQIQFSTFSQKNHLLKPLL